MAAGRPVILVGDLNICPQPIDSCDPGDLSKFRDRADKKWLSSVMKHSGGYFVDLFRHFHPNRSVAHASRVSFQAGLGVCSKAECMSRQVSGCDD